MFIASLISKIIAQMTIWIEKQILTCIYLGRATIHHGQIHNLNDDKYILSSLLIVTSSFIGQMVMNDFQWQDLYDLTERDKLGWFIIHMLYNVPAK